MRDIATPATVWSSPKYAAVAGGLGRRKASEMPVSIRSRLLLLVLSVLLPAVAAALWIIAQTYSAERRLLERNLRDTTRALSLVVDRELSQRAAIARVLSLTGALDLAPQIPAEQLALFETQARRAMQGLAGWVELGSAEGELLNTRRPDGATPARTPAHTPAALAESPFIEPLRAGAQGEWRARIVQPVQREGRTVLNLAVTILPQELQQIVDQQRLPPDWVGAVLDASGTMVAHHPGAAAYAGRPATPDLQARLASHNEALFESTTLAGAPALAYFSTSAQGWTYVTAVPQPQLAQALPRAVWQVSLGALVLLSLAVAGALWVSRSIVGSVVMLKLAASRMQDGKSVARQATGIVECDDVAGALAEAAEAMHHARVDLERQVAAAVARTREAEQRVSQSQRVEALGRFTGGVAHDFNNLLGVISNSAHLIQRQATNPELLLPVAATLRAVEVGSRLTQHLLGFAGRQPGRPQAVHLGHYLPEVQALIKTVLGSRVRVSSTVVPGTRCITVDSSELELALINLALNARDAMPAGGQLWLRAANAEAEDISGLPPGPYVLIAVSDDGSGINDRLAEHVFEPFFTTKPVGQGTGLGLSQVHGFCVQSGGTARLASTPGLGTTVSLLLPASEEPPIDTVLAPPPGDDGPATSAGAHVLLVEDNDELAGVTAALLESHGWRVQRACDPQAALRMLDAEPGFDVVLSDVVMPGGMDGVDLALALRERWPQLPVVLITGYSSALAGARGFVVLHKPCTPEELLGALQQAIAGALRRGQ